MKTLRAAELTAGQELAPLQIPITTTLVVAGALASRDFQDVHHDASIATSSGAKDVFMNILTTGGLVGRYVTDRIGPETIVRTMSIRLGVPNYPGDTMTLTGRVTAVAGDDVTIEIRGANGSGDHVTGTVEVTLP